MYKFSKIEHFFFRKYWLLALKKSVAASAWFEKIIKLIQVSTKKWHITLTSNKILIQNLSVVFLVSNSDHTGSKPLIILTKKYLFFLSLFQSKKKK